MKKRILCMLLCVTMAFAAIGCGSKETASDKAVVENETPEEVVEENVENETSLSEEIVEETFVESEWKKENIVYGETRTTPFGSYVVIGPLEGNPNLEQYEINFDGHIFQVVLPKDMGDSIDYNEEGHTISFYNKDRSKIAGFFYTKGGFDELDAYYSCYYAMQNFGANTENEEIIVLDEETLKAYQFGTSESYNNLAYLSCWNIGSEKTYNDKMYENVGYNYRFFYGENNETFNRETVKTIMESFVFLTDKNESVIATNKKQNENTSYLDSNNKLDSATLEKFGLSNTNLIFKPDTIVESNEEFVTLTIKNVSEEDIRTYITEISNNVELTETVMLSFDLEKAINDITNGMPATYNYSANGNDYAFMVNMSNNTLEIKIKLK